jgi:hypothetical protein
VTGPAAEAGRFHEYAARFGVPALDLQLMTLNLHGIASATADGRARMEVRLDLAPAVEWHVILPTGRRASPCDIQGDTLTMAGHRVGTVRLVEHDDAQLGYPRDGGRVLTLNTNRRSTCTGCVFCPNTLADANDPHLAPESFELEEWLATFLRGSGWPDLSHVAQVNVSTGCFGEEARAVDHLVHVRRVLKAFKFAGRLGLLSSVVRSAEAMRRLVPVGPFAIFLTLECLTRRRLLLKQSKAQLTPRDALDVLRRAREAGHDTGVMIVVGLDPLDDVSTWLAAAAPQLTDFPNLQIFQSHGPFMDVFRADGADTLPFFLEARRVFEQVLRPTTLRPLKWQNYRPLWYQTFGSEALPIWPPGTVDRAAGPSCHAATAWPS